MGGGTTVPGLGLRQNLTSGPGEGFYYRGGIQDAAVWNHFETEGRLSERLESMDIHTWVAVPEAELAQQSCFYMDDFTLQVLEEPPLSLSTALDEYYVGEAIPWTVQATLGEGPIRVTLRRDGRKSAEQTGRIGNRSAQGAFPTQGLRPGIYQLGATLGVSTASPPTAERQVILAPDPFDWAPHPP
jgi:hypothetical protein